MPAKILEQKKIKDVLYWYFSGRDFTNAGTSYSIVGTETTGPGIYDAVHTVKNNSTGNYAKINTLKLVQILKQSD